MGCDFYITSPHKWLLAPKGTGTLYIREELLERLWVTIASGDWRNCSEGRGFLYVVCGSAISVFRLMFRSVRTNFAPAVLCVPEANQPRPEAVGTLLPGVSNFSFALELAVRLAIPIAPTRPLELQVRGKLKHADGRESLNLVFNRPDINNVTPP